LLLLFRLGFWQANNKEEEEEFAADWFVWADVLACSLLDDCCAVAAK
jgi:meiotically up-regulated gene 157 (Mug157) protein